MPEPKIDMSYNDWLVLIEAQMRRYPVMQPSDVYKLLYQATLGPVHLMPSSDQFRNRLQEEILSLTANLDGQLLEPIRPDGTLQRLNLRVWLAQTHNSNFQVPDLQELINLCLRTGQQTWGTNRQLQDLWRYVCQLSETNHFPTISQTDIEVLTSWLAANNYPPIHHSQANVDTYKPAYRLAATQLIGWGT